MSGNNGLRSGVIIPWWGAIIAIVVCSVPGFVGGLAWQNTKLESLENRFVAAAGRFDQLVRDFNAETARERDQDQNLERSIADNRRDIANIQGSLPLKLPTITQLIEADAHAHAQDGRMDEIDRRLRAQADRSVALCAALAKLSAASAKGAGCS